MFSSCLQVSVCLANKPWKVIENHGMVNILHSETETSILSNLKIVSAGGSFSNGGNVYVTLERDDTTLLMGPDPTQPDKMAWSETLLMNRSQIFNLFNLSNIDCNPGTHFCLGRSTKAGIFVLAIENNDSNENKALYLINSAECGEECDKTVLEFETTDYVMGADDNNDDDDQNETEQIQSHEIINSPISNISGSGLVGSHDENIVESIESTVENSSLPPTLSNNTNNNNLISLEFAEGSLGLTIRRRPTGVVYIHDVLPNTQAETKDVRANDEVWSVGTHLLAGSGLNQEQWKGFIQYIKESPRPLVVVVKRDENTSLTTSGGITNANSNTITPTPTSSTLSPLSSPQTKRSTSTSHNNNSPTKQQITSHVDEVPSSLSPPSLPLELEIDGALLELCKKLTFKENIKSKVLQRTSSAETTTWNTKTFLQSKRSLLRAGEITTETKGTLWNSICKKYLILTNDLILICSIQNESSYIVEHVIDAKVCKLRTNGKGITSDLTTLTISQSQESTTITTASTTAVTTAATTGVTAVTSLPNNLSFELLWPNGTITIITKDTIERSEWVLILYNVICNNVNESQRTSFGWRHQCVLGTMHAAVLSRDINRIKELLQMCERGLLEFHEVESPDEEGYTPLHYACILRLHNVIEVLHEASSDVTAADTRGYTPIHWSAMQLDDFTLEKLCMHIFDVDIKDNCGFTPLYLACVEGRDVHGKTDVEALQSCITCLCNLHANVNHRDSRGFTSLHYTAGSLQYPAVQALLDGGSGGSGSGSSSGADPNLVSDSDGLTALHVACMHSPLKDAIGLGVRLLNPRSSTSTSTSFTPEVIHEQDGPPTIRALLDHGACPNKKDANGHTALVHLTNSYDKWGQTALSIASLLLSKGARIDDNDHPKLLQELILKCFPTDQQAQHQWSEMMSAASEQWVSASIPDVEYDSSRLTIDCFLRVDNKNSAMPNETAEKGPCRLCQSPFTLFRRQHHCRLCSHICCDECSKKRITIPDQNNAVRICDGCFNRACTYVLEHRRDPLTLTEPTSLFLSTPVPAPAASQHRTYSAPPPPPISASASPANKRDMDNRLSLFGSSRPKSQQQSETGGSEATMSVMGEAKERLQQRGEKLSQMSDKSADLAKAANEFANLAKQLNQSNKRWW
eukprot:gene4607-9154_t